MILSINDLKQEIERKLKIAQEDLELSSTHSMGAAGAVVNAYKAVLDLFDQLVPEDGKVPMDRKDRQDTKPIPETQEDWYIVAKVNIAFDKDVIDPEEVLADMGYSFTSQSENAQILDTEILDWSIDNPLEFR